MHGSQLFGQQPTFRGADFGIPEVAFFGYVQFRNAVATTDSWDDHGGAELVFVRTGEACWETPGNRLLRLNGGKGIVFPPNHRHRIINGVYTPCQLFWIEFQPLDIAKTACKLIPAEEIEAIFELARSRSVPVALGESLMRNLAGLCSLLADENLLIGSRMLMADLRSKFYAAIVDFWKVSAGERGARSVSPIVREAETLLQLELGHDDIPAISERVGCRKSHLYELFKREIGMAPNDYRQRLRIKQSCDLLSRTDEHVTDIAMNMGYSSSQYFSRVFKKYTGFTPLKYRALFR